MDPKAMAMWSYPSTLPGDSTIPEIPSVVIGTQRWTSKNLSTSTYANGDIIQEVQDQNQWMSLTTGAWCYYNNDPTTEGIYGKMYNWFAVTDPRGIAPIGWRVPNNSDWTILLNFAVPNGILKEVGTQHWFSPNEGATDQYGFTAVPGGSRNTGGFSGKGFNGYYHSTTEYDSLNSNFVSFSYATDLATILDDVKQGAISVRLVKN